MGVTGIVINTFRSREMQAGTEGFLIVQSRIENS